jgi:hypothetical protein
MTLMDIDTSTYSAGSFISLSAKSPWSNFDFTWNTTPNPPRPRTSFTVNSSSNLTVCDENTQVCIYAQKSSYRGLLSVVPSCFDWSANTCTFIRAIDSTQYVIHVIHALYIHNHCQCCFIYMYVYRIRSIRRRGYYLFHRLSLCGVYSRAAFINTSSYQRGNP